MSNNYGSRNFMNGNNMKWLLSFSTFSSAAAGAERPRGTNWFSRYGI